MDTQIHDQQQKDFISSFFPLDIPVDHQQRGSDAPQQSMPMFHFNGATPAQQPPMGMHPSLSQNANGQQNMDMLGNIMAMQGIESQAQGAMSPQTAHYNPQVLLEQQFKLTQLQQLQQLQNQIFQQQIAIISSQTGGIVPESPVDPPRDRHSQHFHNLPTPGSSAELRAQQPTEYVSPMILQYTDTPQENYRNQGVDNLTPLPNYNVHSQYGPPRGSASAPAHIAFRPSPSQPLPSPGELDFDISPLTSPWLGAHHQSMPPPQQSNKRTASPSGDETSTKPARKRQSPAIRPTNPIPSNKKHTRGSKSTNSTPLLRSTRPRKGSTAGDVVGDTPSPVDLSMPPPAPPLPNQVSSSSASSSSASLDHYIPSPDLNAQLMPVTPASIMNLGRLGINSSLAPPTRQSNPSKPDPKAKDPGKPKANGEPASRSRPPKKSAAGTLVSPNLKPILPAGSTPPLNIGSSGPLPQPVMQVRKTSHKAAEQKRRDSLKTTFDDLRLLLPPIPLPSDEKFPDEPILPGALPPRGPPKAGGEGPNKGVSKLQLLMCGNDFIRQLKGRVERRDEEIGKLRREVARLRDLIGNGAGDCIEELDLERDLDAVEAFSAALGRGGSVLADDEADEEGDD